MSSGKHFLVAPLDWGLGHAARCIPVVRTLLDQGHEVMLGGSGASLQLLVSEFPALPVLRLPAYRVTYARDSKQFAWHLIKQVPRFIRVVREEHSILSELVSSGRIDCVISDNRPGLWNRSIPSFYITHQLRVVSGLLTPIATAVHRLCMSRFRESWIVDRPRPHGLAGALSYKDQYSGLNTRHIGLLTRMRPMMRIDRHYDVTAILSGPEPARSRFETQIRNMFQGTQYKVLIVCGVVEDSQTFGVQGNIKTYNYLTQEGLEQAISRSKRIICRAGYTSLMDLAEVDVPTLFVPTPGQTEQEYLARRLVRKQWGTACSQDDLSIAAILNCQPLHIPAAVYSPSLSSIISDALSSVNENSDPMPGALST